MRKIGSVGALGLVLGLCAAGASGCSGGATNSGAGIPTTAAGGAGTGASPGSGSTAGGVGGGGVTVGGTSGASPSPSPSPSPTPSPSPGTSTGTPSSPAPTTPTTGTGGGAPTGGTPPGSSTGSTGGTSGGTPPASTGGTSGGTPAGGTPPAGGGAPTGLTKIYLNAPGGNIYEYDSADWAAENLIVRSTGAFSISSGPAANTLYFQIAGLAFSPSGQIDTYNLQTRGTSTIGGNVPGNAFGEGRNGFLYSGSGYDLYRIDANTGASTYVGYGNWPYAGDLAVDPTTDVLYGAVEGRWSVTLVRVDRATGDQAEVGPMNVAYDIYGLGFSGDGRLFAAGPDGNGRGAIYEINKASGAATQVRGLNYEPYDMATQPYTVNEDQRPSEGGGGAAGGEAVADVYFEETFDRGEAAMLRGTAVPVPGILWEQGAPVAGPGAAASGRRCLATRAAGGYPRSSLATVETASFSLVGARRPVLVLRHWYDTQAGHDGGVVRVRTPLGDAVLEPASGLPSRAVVGLASSPGFSGTSGRWADAVFDLSPYAGQPVIRIAFTFGSDGAVDAAGWFIDDVLVAEPGVVEERLGRTRLDRALVAPLGP